MYSTVLFPNTEHSGVDIQPIVESQKSIHYLDIQAILFADADRHRIGVLDTMDVKGLRVDRRSEELAPYVSFCANQLLKGAAIHDLYATMRENPGHISSSACLTGNITPSDEQVFSCEPVIFGVSPALAFDSWQNICLVACQSSTGGLGFTAISRTSGKGLAMEKLSLTDTDAVLDKPARGQYTIQGELCFGSSWQRASTDGQTRHFSWQDTVSAMCDENASQPETRKFAISMIISHQESVSIYKIEVAPPGIELRATNKKKRSPSGSHQDCQSFASTNFSVCCTRTIEFAAHSVVHSIQPARKMPSHAIEEIDATFCLGFVNGEALEYEIDADEYRHRVLNRRVKPPTKGLTTVSIKQLGHEKAFCFDPVLNVLYLNVPHCECSMVCVVHETYVEWVVAASSTSEQEDRAFTSTDRCILRQELSHAHGGYAVHSPIRTAVLSDMGSSVTVLTTAAVLKFHSPMVEHHPTGCPDEGESAPLLCVGHEMTFRISLRSPEIILQHVYSEQVIKGLIPRYSFAEKFDDRFRANANANTTNTKILNSLSHTLGEVGRLEAVTHKHTSSAFPIAVFSSTSYSRVFYLHFTSRSAKFEHETKDGKHRIGLNEVGNIPLHVPYCVIEYCEGARNTQDGEQAAQRSSDFDFSSLDVQVAPYHTATDNQKLRFWAQRLRSEWLRDMSASQFHELSPWDVLDIKIWERESLTSIDDTVGQRDLRCLTVARHEHTLALHRPIAYETALAAEACADLLDRLRVAVGGKPLKIPATETPGSDGGDPHDKMTFLKNLTHLDDSRTCPFCDGEVARVYQVFYPGILLSREPVSIQSDVYYSTRLRCERGHALEQCEVSSEILIARPSHTTEREYQRCQSCASVFSKAALVNADFELCAHCSLPFV